ncbi:hypothetical protein U1Q18_049201 [Sarracenia purpurea var. burkii]
MVPVVPMSNLGSEVPVLKKADSEAMANIAPPIVDKNEGNNDLVEGVSESVEEGISEAPTIEDNNVSAVDLAPKKNVSFFASGFELEARVVLCIYGVVLDFQRRLPTRVVSSEDRCGRLVHPVLTTGLYDSAETKNVKNEEDAEVAEAVDAEPVSEYEIEEASIYKDEAEVSSYDEEQDEDEENMRMWL